MSKSAQYAETDSDLGRRLLSIPGCHNLRDLGGYPTVDGRRLRWRTLYRSGVMSKVDEAAARAIKTLGLSAIYDLRTSRERTRAPCQWHIGEPVSYHSRDYEMSGGDLHNVLENQDIALATVNSMIREVYKALPFEQAPAYRTIFQLLADQQVPLLFNCSAGKDRTGLAAALVLNAVGVPRSVIQYDYELTELEIDGLVEIFLSDRRYINLTASTLDRYMPLLRADPSYLDIAFSEIERQNGSIGAYLEDVLELNAVDLEKIRKVLLEP